MPVFETLAILAGLGGCYLVYLSWKNQRPIKAVMGWGCMFSSLPFWSLGQGAEFGTLYALSLPAFFVWISISQERKWLGPVKELNKNATTWEWNGHKVISNLGLIFYILPVLMLFSSVMTLSFVHILPINEANQMAVAIIALPLLWGALTFWHLVSAKKVVPLLVSIAGASVSVFHLFG